MNNILINFLTEMILRVVRAPCGFVSWKRTIASIEQPVVVVVVVFFSERQLRVQALIGNAMSIFQNKLPPQLKTEQGLEKM